MPNIQSPQARIIGLRCLSEDRQQLNLQNCDFNDKGVEVYRQTEPTKPIPLNCEVDWALMNYVQVRVVLNIVAGSAAANAWDNQAAINSKIGDVEIQTMFKNHRTTILNAAITKMADLTSSTASPNQDFAIEIMGTMNVNLIA